MSEPDDLSSLVMAVFQAWRREHINFLVLRNYEELPHYTSNDIDILVRPSQRWRAERALVAAARACGYRLHNRAEFATLALYLSKPGTTRQAHFDLFTRLTWRGFKFVESRDLLRRKIQRGAFFIPHPADEAVINLLAYAIYSGRLKEKYKTSIVAGFEADRFSADKLLARSYGKRNAHFLGKAAVNGQWSDIEAHIPRLRSRLVFRHFNRQPFYTLASFVREGWRGVKRLLKPVGCSIVLCGADGCGKSTAAQAVMELLSPTCSLSKSAHFHWKPPVLLNRRRAARTEATNPHGRPVRSQGLSLAYFGFHWLEFFLGSWLRVPGVTFKGGLVVIDRFYYDFFVDQKRYRLAVPRAVVAGGYWFIKKPDLVFLLDAPAEVLQSRKQEVPLAETGRQRQAYLELVKNLPNGIVVDAAKSSEQVASDIAQSILEFMAQR